MRAVIQRVTQASVAIDGQLHSQIGMGLLILLGVETEDTEQDVDWLVKKIPAMRIFNDEAGKMNLSLLEVRGEALVVSQFTLFADTQKGNRPSFIRAARPEKAVPLYEAFVQRLGNALGRPVGTGQFGADMQVQLLNDGPVTIVMDTR
jgi:D-tyrosyl-tRNA(Tyr) deacylase